MASELMLTGEAWLGLTERYGMPPRPFEREIHLMDAPIVGKTCFGNPAGRLPAKLVPGAPLKLTVHAGDNGVDTVEVDIDDGGGCSEWIGNLSRRWGDVAARLMNAGKTLAATLAKRETLPSGWVYLEARITMKEV